MNPSDRSVVVMIVVVASLCGLGYLLVTSGLTVDVGTVGTLALGGLIVGFLGLALIVWGAWRLIGGYVTKALAEAGKRAVDERLNPLPLRRHAANGHADTDPPSSDVRFEDEESLP